MEAKYSPTPWGIQEGRTLLHIETFESERGDGSLDTRTPVCSIPKKRYEDAAHIVKCVNSHDKLVAALKGVIRVADRKTIEFDAAREALAEAGAI